MSPLVSIIVLVVAVATVSLLAWDWRKSSRLKRQLATGQDYDDADLIDPRDAATARSADAEVQATISKHWRPTPPIGGGSSGSGGS